MQVCLYSLPVSLLDARTLNDHRHTTTRSLEQSQHSQWPYGFYPMRGIVDYPLQTGRPGDFNMQRLSDFVSRDITWQNT